jgi:hypothetical protein
MLKHHVAISSHFDVFENYVSCKKELTYVCLEYWGENRFENAISTGISKH